MAATGIQQNNLFQWDPSSVEIRTKSVEVILEPLVEQVTTLVSQKGISKLKKGRSKKAHVLSAAVQKATDNFLERGELIAEKNPEMQNDVFTALDEVRAAGDQMRDASQEFANDPCTSSKRAVMIRAARALLSAVTRLLILADMIDVHNLLRSLRIVEDDIERIRNSSSQQELMSRFKEFGQSMTELSDKACRRQNDLKDHRRRDEIAAARAVLKRNAPMLLTSSKTYVRHPELASAKANRDFCIDQVSQAVTAIGGAAQASGRSDAAAYEAIGELAAALDEFDESIIIDPATYNEARMRPLLEERLENIVSGAALMADSSCTREERRERIVHVCNDVRQALQDLLSEYMANAGKQDPNESLDRAIQNMCRKTRDLRRQLRKAVVDHVSDSFLETSMPLLMLLDAAHAGDEGRVEECAEFFQDHANKLVEVANLACSMSNQEEGVKIVRLAAQQVDELCPQIIHAARVLAARPRSKVAQENAQVFRVTWERQVQLLTDAVDDITTIDDFLSVSESHILEDVNKCVLALQDGDSDVLDRTAGAIRGRCARVCNVVAGEMDNYEPGQYTQKVMESVNVMQTQIVPNFAEKVDKAVAAFASNQSHLIDENDFIEAARLIYDGIRDIRRTVLMIRTQEEIETESDVELEDPAAYTATSATPAPYDPNLSQEDYYQAHSTTSNEHTSLSVSAGYSSMRDEYSDTIHSNENSAPRYSAEEDLIEGQQLRSDRALMRALPPEEQAQIQQQVEYFRAEKAKLEHEVSKWDDRSNDIIVLAKQMCMIMMEMTDFTRGRGPLKTTMDVINAAKRISESGTKLDKLARSIAEQCPDSESKKDLIAYLQRIALYCHQLNITSKVKADVQSISGELVVSGLDSATSLIQAARNLMNAVVLTVKASYVASTKYTRHGGASKAPVVRWRMKLPEKKPLVRPEVPEEIHANVRRGEQVAKMHHVKELSEFST